ncbi:MAG: nitrate/nitrite transporter NrtS [Pseudomonadota bacterium]
MSAVEESFWVLALRPSVVRRAAKVSLVVGIVLMLINHGDVMMAGALTFKGICKIALTFMVPYSVSTYSSVLAIREHDAS